MMQVNTGNSILSELTKRELSKKVGHFGFDITYRTKEGVSLSPTDHFLPGQYCEFFLALVNSELSILPSSLVCDFM